METHRKICFGYSLIILMAMIMMRSQIAEGQGGLKTGFYSSSCPNAEAIVRSTVKYYYDNDPSIAAGVLRLFFHDCFVDGCDGSVLINGTSAERNAIANGGARGFEVIDYAKSQIEASCPGVVSCADILALAARDSVDLSDGPSWNVPLGRRDGRISLASHVNLPSPLDSVAVQRQKFADKGLDDQDLVTLVGAHTIGQTHCRFSSYRLYNFTKTGNADPTISPSFLPRLQNICPANGDGSKEVDLDIDSQKKFDVSFFKNVRDGNAVLESDQRLWGDSVTQKIVKNYAGNFKGLLGVRFAHEFPKAMIKLGSIEVKTGTEGEIREICSRFNYY